MSVTLEQAKAAQGKLEDEIKDLPELCAVGITEVNEDYAVSVLLTDKTGGFDIPLQIDGVIVVVEEVGSDLDF